MTTSHTPSHYDSTTADSYLGTEHLPIRRYAEFPTFVDVVGQVTGASVLDLACGTGIHSRLLADMGAARVVGVDSSSDMISQARRDDSHSDRIEYLVHDVATMPHVGTFDIVTADWLLNYAQSAAQLRSMCERVHEHLRPCGRFVSTIPNSDFDVTKPYDDRYGGVQNLRPGLKDGDVVTFTLMLGGQHITIENYFWTVATYRQTLIDAGIIDVGVRAWMPTSEGIERLGAAYWEPWRAKPANLVIYGTKPAT